MQIIKNIWPEWKVEKEIGQGSYGTVYKCINEKKEYCAIKVISIPQSEHEMSEVISEKMSVEQSREYYKDIADDLIKEIEILKALKGTKNVVEIYDAQMLLKEDGIGWNILIRMELLTDFNTYISDKQLSEADVIKLGTDLSTALSVCHKAKIIHRDIKPENILVDDEGNFKLGDFGVAKQMEKTQGSMSVKGTYNYMSPEVLSGNKCDGRADMYSLAIVMYKLLNNNRLPFVDPNKQIVRYSERQEAFEKRKRGDKIPSIQGVSNELNTVILRACSFDVNERQKDIDEFNKELGYLVKGKRVTNKKLLKKILSIVACFICIFSVFAVLYYFTEVRVHEVESDIIEDVVKEEAGRKYNKIDYDSDGQRLLYYNEYNDVDQISIPYLVDVENETAVDVCELIGIESENYTIGPRDEKHIYYSVAKDKYNAAEIQIGYDLYRYNKQTKESELLLSSETKCIEKILYADDANVYFCEYDETSDYFLMGGPALKKYNIEEKSIMCLGDGVAYTEQYNGYILYTADCGMTFWGYEKLWIYDTYTNKNSLITEECALGADVYFTTDTLFFEEVIVDDSAKKENKYDGARHCIVSYSLKTGEQSVVGELSGDNVWYFQNDEEGQASYIFNQNFAIVVAGEKLSGEEESYDLYEYILNYADGTYNRIEFPREDFSYSYGYCLDAKISDNILYLDNDGYCYKLYEVLPSGIMKQYGDALYINGDVTLCDSKMVLLTGDQQNPVKFYDFLEAEKIDEIEFTENEEDEYVRVTADVEMRIAPSDNCESLGILKPGDIVLREAISENGWSKVYNDEYGTVYVRTDKIELVPITDTYGMCGTNIVWEYNKETRELILTGTGEMYGYESDDYGWDKHRGDIKKITISKGITSISDYAFSACDVLTSVIIPDSVTEIGDWVFEYCTSISVLDIPDSITIIGEYVFYECTNLTRIMIPDSVTSIGAGAFVGCTSLVDIKISSNITSINNSTFYDCSSLASIIIPNGVSTIGDSAFCFCKNLTSITIPDTVLSIGSSAFQYCENLKGITIPDRVTTIGDWAFSDCSSLASVILGDEVAEIGDGVFSGCKSIESIDVDKKNNYYMVDEVGVLYSKDRTSLIQYPAAKTERSYTLAKETETVCDYAFYGAWYLTEIDLSYNLKEIGNYAFAECSSITELNIPDSVTTIGKYAFSSCYSLQRISLPDSVSSVGEGAFYYCNGMTDVRLSSALTRINDYTFGYCSSLQKVTTGSKVTDVGEFAFEECYNLAEIHYNGTMEQWNNISVKKGNNYLTQAKVIYNA
ncbi:MAG: leucine-rich repeat protein [Clostridia bacterium]|nr:leucine-rich repeat protein [Clostridia bacterium]